MGLLFKACLLSMMVLMIAGCKAKAPHQEADISMPKPDAKDIPINEDIAIKSLRSISGAAAGYFDAHGRKAFPASLKALSDASPGSIDPDVVKGDKNGYIFTYVTAGDKYMCFARPSMLNLTGSRTFFVDESGMIRLDDISGKPVK